MNANHNPNIWHEGPPPHIGWWNSTSSPDNTLNHIAFGKIWRWWDGSNWSFACSSDGTNDPAARAAKKRMDSWTPPVLWSYFWPTEAVVARIDPITGEVTGAGPIPPWAPSKQTQPGAAVIDKEYLLVSDKDSKVLKAGPLYGEGGLVKSANLIRAAGGEVTIFVATRL